MMRKLRVVELYAGIARTWDAFRNWRRCQLGLLVDNDEFAQTTYKANFPTAPYWRRNLSWLSPQEITNKAGGHVDILLGCPPCQGFSDTGKRDPDDPRNNHVSVFSSQITALRPYAFAMENVPLLVSSKRYRRFVESVERAGYTWTAAIINAALYGSCQTRQRLLFVGIRKDAGQEPYLPQPTHGGTRRYFGYQSRAYSTIEQRPAELLGFTPASYQLEQLIEITKTPGTRAIPTLAETLEGLPAIGSLQADRLTHAFWDTSARMTRRMARVEEGGRWRGGRDHFSHAYGRLHRRGLSRTITTYFANPGSGRFWHPTDDRPLSVREAARIQGIPDAFTFTGAMSASARLVGNALDGAIADLAYIVVRKALE